MDVRTLAKYPFTKEASQYLSTLGTTLDRLISDRSYEQARLMGKERVLDAIEVARIRSRPITKDTDAVNILLSYPLARMLVSSLNDPALTTKYAIAEAKTAHELLEKRIEGGRTKDSRERLGGHQEEAIEYSVRFAQEVGLDVQPVNGDFSVEFTDFLEASSPMKSKSWKLINQKLTDGRVIVNTDKFLRLTEQKLADKITSELPLPVNEDILSKLTAEIGEIEQVLGEKRIEQQKPDLGMLTVVRFPPCMKELLEMMRSGKNVPHSGRFALVAFLHTLGMDSDAILRTFATSPDFDEGKSRYQIQHISGEISGTEYTPPECSTMKSYGICYNPDDLCSREWMWHPLKYYRSKGRLFRSRK